MNPTKGSIVLYVCHADLDPSAGTPNVCPAVVVDVLPSGKLNLYALFVNGHFTKEGVEQGTAADEANRGKWLPK